MLLKEFFYINIYNLIEFLVIGNDFTEHHFILNIYITMSRSRPMIINVINKFPKVIFFHSLYFPNFIQIIYRITTRNILSYVIFIFDYRRNTAY